MQSTCANPLTLMTTLGSTYKKGRYWMKLMEIRDLHKHVTFFVVCKEFNTLLNNFMSSTIL